MRTWQRLHSRQVFKRPPHPDHHHHRLVAAAVGGGQGPHRRVIICDILILLASHCNIEGASTEVFFFLRPAGQCAHPASLCGLAVVTSADDGESISRSALPATCVLQTDKVAAQGGGYSFFLCFFFSFCNRDQWN